MSRAKNKRLGGRIASIVAATALMLSFGASAAFAKVTLEPAAPGPYNSGAKITVKVTGAPAAATQVAIAECNISEGEAKWGKRCNVGSAKGPSPLSGGALTFTEVPILRIFTDTDFTVNPPKALETETTCKKTAMGAGSQCAILASYYKPKMGGGLEQIGAEVNEKFIFFN